jgi:hypothetical protein
MNGLAFLLLATNLLGPPAQPSVALRAGRVCVSRPPEVLKEKAVASHLNTGLTTTFLLELKIAGPEQGRLSGHAQIELRYELWDEKYLLASSDSERVLDRHEAASPEALLAWWQQLTLCPIATEEQPRERPWRATVTLTVLPFSRAEQEDAQAWFSQTLRGAKQSARATHPVVVTDSAELRDLPTALIATSIGRRSLITYSWQAQVSSEGTP